MRWRVSFFVSGATIVLLTACPREEREFRTSAPGARAESITIGDLRAGAAPQPSGLSEGRYQETAWAVSEGQRLYNWFNCNGCHFNGGGGIGPPLMDSKWIYGKEPANIFASIVEGRPDGMPAFQGRIPDHQVWQLVAYVRSLAGLVRPDSIPSRADHMKPRQHPESESSQESSGEASPTIN